MYFGHKSSLRFGVVTKDSVKGRSVGARLLQLEKFLREHLSTLESKVVAEGIVANREKNKVGSILPFYGKL